LRESAGGERDEEEEPSLNRTRVALLTVAAVWLTFCVVTVVCEVAFPGPDVFQFKGAGVYFAQHGLLGGVNMPFSPPNVPAVYAFYPPVYAFLFGVWSMVAGVSLQASTGFDLLLRTLRALAIAGLIWPSLKKSDDRARLFVAVTLLLLSIAPNNEDRPDELGLIFGLASWLVLLRGRSAVAAGVLLGLCAASSPAGGLFSAIGVLFICRARIDAWKAAMTAAAVSALTAIATVVPVVIADRTAIERFLTGVRFNALPYNKFASQELTDHASVVDFIQLNMIHLKGGIALLPLLVVLAILVVWSWKRADAASRKAALPAAAAAAVFLPITLMVFPKEPIYPWFSCVGLIVALLCLTLSHRRYRVVQVALVCGMAIFLGREAKMMYDGFLRPADQTVEAAQARLLKQIEPSARIAGFPDTIFTLAGARPYESLQFSCGVLETYDYVFVTDGTTFPTAENRAQPLPLAYACGHPAVACFTVQDDFRSTQPVSILGWRPGVLVRGFGGVLFKRTGC
jgi:hypothetical protein